MSTPIDPMPENAPEDPVSEENPPEAEEEEDEEDRDSWLWEPDDRLTHIAGVLARAAERAGLIRPESETWFSWEWHALFDYDW